MSRKSKGFTQNYEADVTLGRPLFPSDTLYLSNWRADLCSPPNAQIVIASILQDASLVFASSPF